MTQDIKYQILSNMVDLFKWINNEKQDVFERMFTSVRPIGTKVYNTIWHAGTNIVFEQLLWKCNRHFYNGETEQTDTQAHYKWPSLIFP